MGALSNLSDCGFSISQGADFKSDITNLNFSVLTPFHLLRQRDFFYYFALDNPFFFPYPFWDLAARSPFLLEISSFLIWSSGQRRRVTFFLSFSFLDQSLPSVDILLSSVPGNFLPFLLPPTFNEPSSSKCVTLSSIFLGHTFSRWRSRYPFVLWWIPPFISFFLLFLARLLYRPLPSSYTPIQRDFLPSFSSPSHLGYLFYASTELASCTTSEAPLQCNQPSDLVIWVKNQIWLILTWLFYLLQNSAATSWSSLLSCRRPSCALSLTTSSCPWPSQTSSSESVSSLRPSCYTRRKVSRKNSLNYYYKEENFLIHASAEKPNISIYFRHSFPHSKQYGNKSSSCFKTPTRADAQRLVTGRQTSPSLHILYSRPTNPPPTPICGRDGCTEALMEKFFRGPLLPTKLSLGA